MSNFLIIHSCIQNNINNVWQCGFQIEFKRMLFATQQTCFNSKVWFTSKTLILNNLCVVQPFTCSFFFLSHPQCIKSFICLCFSSHWIYKRWILLCMSFHYNVGIFPFFFFVKDKYLKLLYIVCLCVHLLEFVEARIVFIVTF